jgi:hypothetical protein
MKMYEARPGVWLCEGVTYEENQAAWAGNYRGNEWTDYLESVIADNDERRVWITLDNRKIPYSELTDGHLENIIAMLQRNKKLFMFPSLEAEFVRRKNDETKR